MTELQEKKCMACEAGVPPLKSEQISKLLLQTPEWEIQSGEKVISRHFKFKNFYHVMAFANAVAWIANQENHHPDVMLGYNYCKISYTTHAIDGLSENDFICAAKINALLASS